MHIKRSAVFLVIAGALAVGSASEASAQRIPRSPKDAPPPPRADTVRITVRDTVTVFRRDTLTVTRWDTVRIEPIPAPVIVPGAFYFGPTVGATIPFKNLSRGHHAGWNVGLIAGWHPAASPFGIQLEGTYHRISELSQSANLAGDASLMTLNGNLKLGVPLFTNFLQAGRVYAVGGPTFAYNKNLRWSTKDRPNDFFIDEDRCTVAATGCPERDEGNMDWGWNAGLGLQVADRVIVESKFHGLLGDGNRYFITPITFGFTF